MILFILASEIKGIIDLTVADQLDKMQMLLQLVQTRLNSRKMIRQLLVKARHRLQIKQQVPLQLKEVAPPLLEVNVPQLPTVVKLLRRQRPLTIQQISRWPHLNDLPFFNNL